MIVKVKRRIDTLESAYVIELPDAQFLVPSQFIDAIRATIKCIQEADRG